MAQSAVYTTWKADMDRPRTMNYRMTMTNYDMARTKSRSREGVQGPQHAYLKTILATRRPFYCVNHG